MKMTPRFVAIEHNFGIAGYCAVLVSVRELTIRERELTDERADWRFGCVE